MTLGDLVTLGVLQIPRGGSGEDSRGGESLAYSLSASRRAALSTSRVVEAPAVKKLTNYL